MPSSSPNMHHARFAMTLRDPSSLATEWFSTLLSPQHTSSDISDIFTASSSGVSPHLSTEKCISGETTKNRIATDDEATQCSDLDRGTGQVSLSKFVRELADLNVCLIDHTAILPPIETQSPSDRIPSPDGRLFTIDETFRMTQQLVDIMGRLFPRSGSQPGPVPDQGTLLLIMSCANRVFDVYEIWSHARLHQAQYNTGDDGRENDNCPPAPHRVIRAPKLTAIAMQMLMMAMMASELFNQLQQALGVWDQNATPPVQSSHGHFERIEHTTSSSSHFPRSTKEATSEISRKAGSVAAKIINTRQLLLSMPDVVGTGSSQKTSMQTLQRTEGVNKEYDLPLTKLDSGNCR
ncbi:putative Isoflavipucine cluster transcription factor like protein [Seiridium cardinale]